MMRTVLVGLTLGTAALAADHSSSATFTKDVLPILQKNCQSCHRPGQVAPMPLITYKDARPWAKAIKSAVVLKKMPPWFADPKYGHFINDRSLNQSEINTLSNWADTGVVEGDPKDAPAPIDWPKGGWEIQPEVVMDLPPPRCPSERRAGVGVDRAPVAVPKRYLAHFVRNFAGRSVGGPSHLLQLCEAPAGDRIQPLRMGSGATGCERVPTPGNSGLGNLPDIHTAMRNVGSTEVQIRPGAPTLRANNDFCYLPGNAVDDYRPWNAGKFVPAGSDMIISLHYTTNGKAVVDRTKIGFTVAKTPPRKKFIMQQGGEDTPVIAPTEASSRAQFSSAYNPSFAIPPNEANYRAPPMDITFLKDVELVRLRPHAHVRGKSTQYSVTYPDGRDEVVLSVPRYDFNWQVPYGVAMKLPKGSKLHFEFRYDNSANNKNNPDPNRWVYQGFQSWEEMMAPNLGFLLDLDADVGGLMSVQN